MLSIVELDAMESLLDNIEHTGGGARPDPVTNYCNA